VASVLQNGALSCHQMDCITAEAFFSFTISKVLRKKLEEILCLQPHKQKMLLYL